MSNRDMNEEQREVYLDMTVYLDGLGTTDFMARMKGILRDGNFMNDVNREKCEKPSDVVAKLKQEGEIIVRKDAVDLKKLIKVLEKMKEIDVKRQIELFKQDLERAMLLPKHAREPNAVPTPPRLHEQGVQTGPRMDDIVHLNTLVKYKNTEYIFYISPAPKSQVVLEEQEPLTEELNIPKLVDKMQLIPDFLRLAYFGVLGNKELCKKIRKTQSDFMELIKQCSVAAIQLQIKASGLIETVQYGFDFLLVSKNNFALEYFKNVGVINEEMLKAMKPVKDQAEKMEKEIEMTLKVTTEEYRRDDCPAGLHEGMALRWAEIQRARLDEERANRELLKMVETMKRIDMQTDSEGMLKMALRGAETGVRALLQELKPVIVFWENLSVQCDSIAWTGTAARLKKAASPTERNKKELWPYSTPFKRQVLKFLARWVALRKVCQDFQPEMEKLGEEIHLCVQEDPSVDEARRRVKDLLAGFDARIERDKEALMTAYRDDSDASSSTE